MDGGCNPQKRFIAQLASIATYGNSNLVLEKKKEGHSHYALKLHDSDETVIIEMVMLWIMIGFMRILFLVRKDIIVFSDS